jgi:hypothetical protein
MLVPGLRGLLEPGADLGRVLRVLAIKRAPLEDALDGLGHVQPAAAEWGVERHDAVLAEPEHHLGTLVAGEVVPDEEHAQRRQLGKVKRSVRPSCQTSQARRVTAVSGGAVGGGIVARITSSRSLSQPCRIGLVQPPTG